MFNLKRSRALWAGGAVLTVAAIALSGCSSTPTSSNTSSASTKPFKILALLSLSGPVAAVGTALEQGLEVGVDSFNKQGGIDGRKIQLTVEDTGAVPENAVGLLQKAIAAGKPDFVIAGNTSNETVALCPLLNRNKILSTSVSADLSVGDPSTCQYNFSTSLSVVGSQEALASYIKSKGYKSAGLLTSSDAFGVGALGAAKDAFKKQGVPIAATQQFDVTALDISTQWTQLQSSKPKVVEIEGQGPAIGYALQGREKVGWSVPVILGPGASSTVPVAALDAKALSGVAEFTYAVAVRGKAPSPTLLNKFLPLIEKKNGNKFPVPLSLYTFGYDEVAIPFEAGKVAGASDTAALLKALTSFGSKKPANAQWLSRGNYSFTPQSHFAKPGDLVPAVAAQAVDGRLDAVN